MQVKIVVLFFLGIIFLGALSGGKDLGDIIRKGVRVLLLLALLIVVLIFLTDGQEIVLEWLLDQLSTQSIPQPPKNSSQ